MRVNTLCVGSVLSLLVVACSGSDGSDGATGVGGSSSANLGQGGSTFGSTTPGNPLGGGSVVGPQSSGGVTVANTSGGATSAVTGLGGSGATTGGATTGGTTSVGGSNPAFGGSAVTGGTSAKGGSTSVGGTSAKGGSTSVGGTSAKGGSTSVGGTTAKGGSTSVGGTSAKGGSTSVGGTTATNTAGAGACDWSTPPSNVSAWVDESWNAQLGPNIKGRQAWLIDNAYKGKGQINLCVRWGATSAPTADVKTNLASTVQSWFNDWFSQLNGYGCFPYPNITVKITGWAVRPGNTGWVSDLGSAVKIYTETDGSGEPKCPDSCSFFSNWSHSFPNCPGGEAFHTDYWMWIDDTNAAAAEGGDWGLRMPVASLNNAMKKIPYDVNTIIHEMGHGFGFQDYYDWTGSKPAGGSVMIIGNTPGQADPIAPTVGDRWLLRRAWKETKSLRAW